MRNWSPTWVIARRITIFTRIQIPYSALGNSNNIVTGLDREDWTYSSIRSNPASAEARRHNSAAYLQNVLTLRPGTTLSLGGRLQRVEFSADDSSLPAAGASG